jgi:glycosyltransferase involved in cell wall biosynthesis
MQTLSLCMIVKNEARNLPRSLAPLMPYVDEAVVVDTGSTDGTPDLAARRGARVHPFHLGL